MGIIGILLRVALVVWGLLKLLHWHLRRNKWGSIDRTNEINVRGKVVLITGASAGIGKATTLEFASRDAIVILACRDLNKADATVNWVRTKTSLGELVCMKLDLASLKSVREFCGEFKAKYDHIDILVNNAGLLVDPEEKRRTVDGFEMHMGVNHLGHFLMTNLLLLKKGAPSRIVTVSSMGHSWSPLDLTDIMSDEKRNDGPHPFMANALYCRSKMANVLFNKELSKRLEGSGVNTYGLCPGGVVTDIGQDVKGGTILIFRMLYPIFQYVLKTAEEGAATTMYCALSKNLSNKSGEMYENCAFWDPKDRAVLKDEDAKKTLGN